MSAVGVIDRQVVHEAPPGWAEVSDFIPPNAGPLAREEGGVRFWLVDDQVNVEVETQTYLVRRVSEVMNPDGLNGAASVEIVFDPVFERAAVHFVRILRGGEVRDLPTADAFEVFRRERDLERARLDGRLTAHMIIPDLRVGDIVDYCWSVRGHNPALLGKTTHWRRLQWSVGVERARFRLLSPPGREFVFRTWGGEPDFEEVRTEGLVERTWSFSPAAALRLEPGQPPEWMDHTAVVATETRSWAEVANLFAVNYETSGPLPATLQALVDDIASCHEEVDDRVVAALRLVQGDIRYLAISIGEGGFVPRDIDVIWQSRFGDCKDASRLLVAILRQLGIEAVPALVNTQMGYGLNDWPAAPVLFDHCVVRARVGDQVLWLDPTRHPQGGRLETLAQPGSAGPCL